MYLVLVLGWEGLTGPPNEGGGGLAELAGHAVDRGDHQVVQGLQAGSGPKRCLLSNFQNYERVIT